MQVRGLQGIVNRVRHIALQASLSVLYDIYMHIHAHIDIHTATHVYVNTHRIFSPTVTNPLAVMIWVSFTNFCDLAIFMFIFT